MRLEVGPHSTGKKQEEKDEEDERNRRLERRDLQQVLWQERNAQEMVDGAAQDEEDAFVRKLELSPDAARLLEQATLAQSSSPLWFSARKARLTALNFGAVFRMMPKTDPENLVKRMMSPAKVPTFAMARGTSVEPTALREYQDFKQRQGKPVSVEMSGLVMNDHFPFLGVSSDALVCDPSEVVGEQKPLLHKGSPPPEVPGGGVSHGIQPNVCTDCRRKCDSEEVAPVFRPNSGSDGCHGQTLV